MSPTPKKYLSPDFLLQHGKYRILRLIGEGGFGCTYEAVHVKLNKKVAIKELFVDDLCERTPDACVSCLSSRTIYFQRLLGKFVAEAKTMASLKHPGIVHVTDVFEENGTAYYVMDFIDGQSLEDIIKHSGPLSEKDAIKYIKQIGEALEYVHSNNILHLDVKPANIIINSNNEAILIDFGTAKLYNEDEGGNSATVIGHTLGYAPIELVASKVEDFKPASDVYSLGATLYKTLTGTTPIGSANRASGTPLIPLPSSITGKVQDAILKAMSVNIADRYQTVGEFVSCLPSEWTENKNHKHDKPNIKKRIIKITPWLIGVLCLGAAIVIILSRPFNTLQIHSDMLLDSLTTAQLEVLAENDDEAQNTLGERYYNQNRLTNIQKSIDLWKKSSERGNSKAMYNLALCYFTGEGLPKNYDEAFALFKKSYDMGFLQSAYNLAVCYFGGYGTQIDSSKAETLLAPLAEQGNADAYYLLGAIYESEGLTSKALKYYDKAVSLGCSDAKDAVNRLNSK